MKIYLIGTLFLLAVHQAAAQGLFGPSAGGGGEPAEGAGGAGGEGGTGAGGGLAALLGGAGGGGGGEPAEGGATRNPSTWLRTTVPYNASLAVYNYKRY
ncbi:hypothetical protein DPMN_065494 [Dreissena polymorpha]|uniref:Uncharacterized protein n=1 Tax=Dreissena polymorpha TaxID=45954 RepID=A0A9D4BS45_DREPO|nr:hypothetical protein DPMN_065494 [Dreissena polymorpha]